MFIHALVWYDIMDLLHIHLSGVFRLREFCRLLNFSVYNLHSLWTYHIFLPPSMRWIPHGTVLQSSTSEIVYLLTILLDKMPICIWHCYFFEYFHQGSDGFIRRRANNKARTKASAEWHREIRRRLHTKWISRQFRKLLPIKRCKLLPRKRRLLLLSESGVSG